MTPATLQSVKRGGKRGRRRAFALPLVMMLALAGTLLVAVMLDRQSGQTRGLGKQIESARAFHFQRGLREIFQAWVKSVGRQQPLRNAIDLDGKIGDINLADGTRITMYAYDAQGKVRADLMGLTRQEREDAHAILDALGPLSPARRRELTREYGPLPVSIFSAPIETLSAIVDHVTGGVHSSDVLEAIINLRDDPKATSANLAKPEITQHLEDEQNEQLQRLVTASPRLWEVVLDAQLGPEFAVVPTRARYWGLLLMPEQKNAGNSYASRVQVLTWNTVDLEKGREPPSVEQWRRSRDLE